MKRVDSKKTSQTCSACGFTSKENRPSRKNFSCQSCGFEADADFNAAINIKNRGVLKLLEKAT